MSKFIMLQPIGGNPFLLRVDDIHSVEMVRRTTTRVASRITVVDAGGRRDYLVVDHTIDEIEGALEGEIARVPREPVQQPEWNPDGFLP